jgi:hypothetical protein
MRSRNVLGPVTTTRPLVNPDEWSLLTGVV